MLDDGTLAVFLREPSRSVDADGIFSKVFDQVSRDMLPPNPELQAVMDKVMRDMLPPNPELQAVMDKVMRDMLPPNPELQAVMDKVMRDMLPPNPELQAVMDKVMRDMLPPPSQLAASVDHFQFVGTLLRDAERYSSPQELAAAIEPTAPTAAEQIRSLTSPQAIAAYVTILAMIVQMIVQVGTLVLALDKPPPQGPTDQVIVKNHTTNVTILPPAPPPSAPPGQSGPEKHMSTGEKVLVEALDDWVPLGAVHWHAQRDNPSAPMQVVQETTINVVRSLVGDGLCELGDLSGKDGQFIAWDTPLDESLKRLSDMYIRRYDDEQWSMSVWLNLTEKGERTARPLFARYVDSLR